jgi:hypothetical protein
MNNFLGLDVDLHQAPAPSLRVLNLWYWAMERIPVHFGWSVQVLSFHVDPKDSLAPHKSRAEQQKGT